MQTINVKKEFGAMQVVILDSGTPVIARYAPSGIRQDQYAALFEEACRRAGVKADKRFKTGFRRVN